MRKTKQKDLIMQALRDLDGRHPTAEAVHDHLREDSPRLSLATVYRNLNQFAQDGRILKVEFPGEPARYDMDAAQHLHALCDECHEVIDLPTVQVNALLTAIEDRLTATAGIEVTRFDLMIHGHCADCLGEEAAVSSF